MASQTPQDQPKTAPRGSWRAFFSLLKIVLILDSFWLRFGPILGPQNAPHNEGRLDVEGFGSSPFLAMLSLSYFVRHRDAQEVPKRPQAPPKSAQRGSQRLPRAPQEAPRGPQEIPRAGQEGSRPSKIAPRGSKRHRGRLTSKRGTWSNSKDALLRCPATEWRTGMPKDGGRAAVSPQRGRQSAATRRVGVCLDSFEKLFEFLEIKRV